MLKHYVHFSRKQLNGVWILLALSHFFLAGTFFLSPPNTYTPAQQQADQQLLDSLYQQWQDSLRAQRRASWNKEKQGQTGQSASLGNTKAYTRPQRSGHSGRQTGGASKKPAKQPYKTERFDLAKADTSQLKRIRGIGSVLSARIVKFRDLLGGFYSLEQVKEVYGLKPEVAERLLERAYLSTKAVKQLPINQIDEQALAKHPYISYKLAKVLCQYRKHHGNYPSASALDSIRMLSPENKKRLLPYLDFKPAKE